MIFRRGRKTVSKNLGRMDKLVTGIIITGAAASILGYSKTKGGKIVTEKILNHGKNYGEKSLTFFGKLIVIFLRLFKK